MALTCECGCGEKPNPQRRFIVGHNLRRREWDERELRRLYWSEGLSIPRIAEIYGVTNPSILYQMRRLSIPRRPRGNPAGYLKDAEAISYQALHRWVGRNKPPKTGVCVTCGKEGRTVWANVSGEYRRDLDDYAEKCQGCNLVDGVAKHERFKDGRPGWEGRLVAEITRLRTLLADNGIAA